CEGYCAHVWILRGGRLHGDPLGCRLAALRAPRQSLLLATLATGRGIARSRNWGAGCGCLKVLGTSPRQIQLGVSTNIVATGVLFACALSDFFAQVRVLARRASGGIASTRFGLVLLTGQIRPPERQHTLPGQLGCCAVVHLALFIHKAVVGIVAE